MTRKHSLLLALSGTCYTRGARAVAERNATQGTAPAEDHFPRNFSRVAGNVARLFPCARWVPTGSGRFNEESSMAGYGGVDFIDFDSQLNDEEKLVRQTARQFVENE